MLLIMKSIVQFLQELVWSVTRTHLFWIPFYSAPFTSLLFLFPKNIFMIDGFDYDFKRSF